MKQNPQLQKWFASAACALALAGSAGVGMAQAPDYSFPFDASAPSWIIWNGWGLQGWPLSWDSTLDAGNDPASGSVRFEVPFTGAAGEQIMTFMTLHNQWGWDGTTMVDGTLYTNLIMSFNIDPISAPDKYNGYGAFEVGLTLNGWGTKTLNNFTLPLTATNKWTTITNPISATLSGISQVNGFYVKMWSDGQYTNQLNFNVDNCLLQAIPTNVPPPPPPTVSLVKPVPGLAFIAASGGQYDRQEIRTVGSNYTWVGASGPVSYSVDVAKIGETNPAGFTLFVHFVPGIPTPTDPSSDYTETNVLMLTIASDADGSGWASLRYKTNAPASNGHMWDTGALPNGAWNPTTVGIWTITFSQDTNVVITAPGGGAATNTIPPEVVAIFNAYPNMQVNVGAVPGDPSRLGQMAVVTGVKFTGVPGELNVNSDFLNQPLDTNVWRIVAVSANYGVQQISTNAAYWVDWTLPASGYSLQTKAALGPGTWTDSTVIGYETGTSYYNLFNKSDLPGSNSGYFRLIKRIPTQLQVLLPGETNAPGTATGKIGTPDPQTAGNTFDLTVNMCDPTWNIVSSSDTVTFTSDDPNAFLPPDTALVNGTVTIVGNTYFGSFGTFTITAADFTKPAILPGTSTPITISQ